MHETKTIVGILLVVAGVAAYLAVIISAILRVHSQYSRHLQGAAGMYFSATLAAVARVWPLLAVLLLGAILLTV